MTAEQILEQALVKALNECYPSLVLDILIKPTLDLKQGQLNTDLPQRIAAELKIDPDDVAKLLVPKLKELVSADINYYKGIIDFKYVVPQFYKQDQKIDPNRKFQIFVISDCERLAALEYFRFIARPFLQAYLALINGHVVDLQVGTGSIVVQKPEHILELFWQHFIELRSDQRKILSSDQLNKQLDDFIASHQKNSFLWLAPRSFDKKSFNQIYKKLKGTTINFQCPERSWLNAIDRSGVLNIQNDRVLDLLLLLNSDEPGRSLDWYVATANENANLSWYLMASYQRIKKLMGANKRTYDANYEFTAAESDLIFRSWQMPLFYLQAYSLAELANWQIALMDLLDQSNRYFNNPTTRQALESDAILSKKCHYILSVVEEALCPIIKLYILSADEF